MEVSLDKSHPKKNPALSKAPRQKRKEAEAMGLCVNCAHMESCTLPGCGAASLMHCEEFFCERGECSSPSASEKPAASVVEEAAVPEFKGLCINCDHRLDCTYGRPASGVWHCAEYQ